MKRNVITAAALGLLIGMATVSTSIPVAYAQTVAANVFDMSTAYPGVYVKAGDNTTFSLDFLNTTGSSVEAKLSIEEMPDGWDGFFKGKNGEVNRVCVAASDDASEGLVTFSLSVPEDAAEGSYDIVLKADDGQGNSDETTIEVTITEVENGTSTYTAEYPEQQAASGSTFSFSTTLVNNRSTAESYSLTSSAPQGWTVSFTPSGESASVASVDLDAGESKVITVKLTPPETLTEGEYTVPIAAVSSNDNLSTDLKVTITGQYAVSVSTPDGRLSFDAYSNDTKDVTITVTNSGNVDLTNVNLSAQAPTDWEVSFDESTIELLGANESKDITMHVKPASDSMTGDYVTYVTAANDIATSSVTFRVSVKTRTTWGIAAIGIIVIMLIGLGGVIKKYGRR